MLCFSADNSAGLAAKTCLPRAASMAQRSLLSQKAYEVLRQNWLVQRELELTQLLAIVT